jgi:hypothetical protein
MLWTRGTAGAKITHGKVGVKFHASHEVSQTDRYTGRVIDRDKQTETHVNFVAEVELRGIAQGFVVSGFTVQRGCDTEKLAGKLRAAVIAGLPNGVALDLFRPTEISVKPDAPELDVYEAESAIDSRICDAFERQGRVGNEAVKQWQKSIQEMKTGLDDGYHYHRSEIRDAFMFFERCNSASWQGMMYSWCEEKLGRIRSGFTTLDKRKNPNHRGYREIVGNINGCLSSWPVVNVWHEHPPHRQSA